METLVEKKFKLNREFAEKWVAALRSGEYKQGTNYLFNESKDSYCCLGVACVINNVDKNLLMSRGWPVDIKVSDRPSEIPSILFEQGSHNFEFTTLLATLNDSPSERFIKQLLMNGFNVRQNKMIGDFDFNDIADFIEDNVEFI